MRLDGQYRAVVDRIEDGLAVLEVEVNGDLHELVVNADCLPRVARRADAVVDVTLQDGTLRDATYDRRATRHRRRQAQTRFDRLSRRLPRDDEE
ncbi:MULTISPECIES: DUF3006 family protein [Salinibaculum]|uniref:DUF3006 family protein n=1 Tax=Salinibaculum TaxID=2732368 RepID=UPI0030CE8FF6